MSACVIALAVDDRYVQPALTVIRSLAANSPVSTDWSLGIVTNGLSAMARDAIEREARRCGLGYELRELGAVSNPTCLRLYLGELFRDASRVLYLDADVLVLDDVTPLLMVELDGHAAGAVVNHPPLDVVRVAIQRSRRGEIDPDAPYFNAGVLVVDTERWCALGVGQRARGFLDRWPRSRLLDQDALNVALAGDWLPLDRRWNAPAGDLRRAPSWAALEAMSPRLRHQAAAWDAARRDPGVLHFIGHPKPWDASYPWPDLSRLHWSHASDRRDIPWPSALACERTYRRA